MKLDNAKKIHCVGIGGVGISAIAKLLAAGGKEVSGTDAADSEIVKDAARAGIKTKIGHSASLLSLDAELLIYSEAVPEDNPEREEARRRKIPEISGAEALAALTRGKRLIAVTGTNGKSTVTALLGLLLEAGGFDPTVIVGSKVRAFPLGNVRVGKSEWFVLEADEYRGKFLRLTPEFAVLTNIEADHLDYFEDLTHIRDTYQAFLERVKPDGRIFLNSDDFVSMNDLDHGRDMITYGIMGPADYMARGIAIRSGRQFFDLLRTSRHEEIVGKFSLAIPGRFNIMNALAALAAALELGIDARVSEAVLESFPGIWRRFETVGKFKGALIISDYAHHPTAIRETIAGAREFFPDSRIVAVFQPHHHHRTVALFREFSHAFDKADLAILSETYDVRGRERDGVKVSAADLVSAIRERGRAGETHFGGGLADTAKFVRGKIKKGDAVIFMGAGDIDSLARSLPATP